MKSVKFFVAFLIPAAVGTALMSGCSTAPPTQTAKEDLSSDSHAAFADMKRIDPSLDGMLQNAYGWVVFPNIGKGAAGIGGAYGRGEVYEQGKFIGYADVSEGTIGAQVGGQTYAELIVFQTKAAMDNFKSNSLKFAADASAVALKSGAASSVNYANGVAVFTQPHGGWMVAAAIGGQQFTFESAQSADAQASVQR